MRFTARPAWERFWEKVRKTAVCWLWTGATKSSGTPRFAVERSMVMNAALYSWEIANGPVPEGQSLRRSCTELSCVRPDHLALEPGTARRRMKRPKRPLAERFWEKVSKGEGCWTWTANTENGYGRIMNDGQCLKATHVSWEIHHGPVPDGQAVLHSCDNPPCVNPAHLFLGTDVDNVADCIEKGRYVQNTPLGERHGMFKLTDAQVLEIRSFVSVKTATLAERFGVHPSTIQSIRAGRSRVRGTGVAHARRAPG